jgi:hypothetical protein
MNWNITKLNVKPAEGNLKMVVVSAEWEVVAHDEGFTGRYNGTHQFQPPQGEFTAFKKLTKELVLSWIWADVDKENHEQAVLAQIELQKNPPIIAPSLPWE